MSQVCRDHGPMRRLVTICLLMSLGAYVSPALGVTAKELIQKGYARDLKRCKAKWQALLKLCLAHPDPTIANNCGVPRPTTTSSTSTTTTTEPSTSTAYCAPTTTTTTLGCDDAKTRVWSPCGPPDRGCTCHHFPGGQNYQFICVDVGIQVRPVYLPCPIPVNSDQECRDCLDDANNTNIACIKGQDEPPLGACVELCQ